LLDSVAGFFGGDQAALSSGLHSLFQDPAGCWAYFNRGPVANKRIDAVDLGHTFTLAQIGGLRKRVVEESSSLTPGRCPQSAGR
jgi:hypothetical protein